MDEMANAVELLLDNIKAGKKETIESLYKDYYFDIESFGVYNKFSANLLAFKHQMSHW